MNRRSMLKYDYMNAGERFADAFSLPKDMVVNATLIHMIGKSDVFVENFKGIISYTCHEVLIKGYGVKFCVCGEGLLIEHYCNDDMKISGQISEVRVIRET